MLPSAYRDCSVIVKLNKFSLEEIDRLFKIINLDSNFLPE